MAAIAFSYLLPGLSPTTTNDVFFETDPELFAPREVTASTAWSRLYRANVPVTTTDNPSSGRGPSSSPATSAKLTPATRHFSMIAACQSTASQLFSASAMIGPTPSTAASSSTGAASIRSIDRNSRASACEAVGPTCRIDNATSARQSGRVFDTSRPRISRSPRAPRTRPVAPAFFSAALGARVKKSTSRNRSGVTVNRSPSSCTSPASSSAWHAS